MKIHRFIGSFDLHTASETVVDDTRLFNQLKNVLRLAPGEKILIGNGRGEEAEAEIKVLEKEKLVLKINEVRPVRTEPVRKVKLFCAVLKKENFELATQKATEIGVSEITPMITERTVKTGLNEERLQKIIKEAAEQSGRGILPVLHPALKLEEVLLAKAGKKILFDPSGAPLSSVTGEEAAIFIGPEGGFTEAEIALARKHGAQIATFGPLIFRAETAVIIATYLAARV